MQNELTEFTAERALTHYMEQLDGLAFLEVVATWYQVEVRIMHVFARTKGGDPATYYHRQFQQERYWTPWVKVDLEITGDQLLAFSRNRRLHLAWPIFSEEPDPNPQATVPDSTAGTVVNTDKPKRKLKIQLAVSELADGVWQPKRISKDAIRTPGTYTTDAFEQHLYNLIFIEWADMVLLLKANGQDSAQLRGVFNIAGCKGYPELLSEGNTYFPDFFPDFKDTLLTVQRYRETNYIAGEELAARTALSPFAFYDILMKTPGTFRVTYPHQMTVIDWVALLLQYLLLAAYGRNTAATYDRHRGIKIPMGTLLPYFMEDSDHAYVITPGLYTRPDRDRPEATVQRTASDVLSLIEDNHRPLPEVHGQADGRRTASGCSGGTAGRWRLPRHQGRTGGVQQTAVRREVQQHVPPADVLPAPHALSARRARPDVARHAAANIGVQFRHPLPTHRRRAAGASGGGCGFQQRRQLQRLQLGAVLPRADADRHTPDAQPALPRSDGLAALYFQPNRRARWRCPAKILGHQALLPAQRQRLHRPAHRYLAVPGRRPERSGDQGARVRDPAMARQSVQTACRCALSHGGLSEGHPDEIHRQPD